MFGTSLEECKKRVRERTNHKTLLPGVNNDAIVTGMSSKFVFPNEEEGFGFCRVVRSATDRARVMDEIGKWVIRTRE